MSNALLRISDRLALLHPAHDAHTLGVSSFASIMEDCGLSVRSAGQELCRAAEAPQLAANGDAVAEWLRSERITVLGLSHRLDPRQASDFVGAILGFLRTRRLWAEQGGLLRVVLFAGLPDACLSVAAHHPEVARVFPGDESPAELIDILGLDPRLLPAAYKAGSAYDSLRMDFATGLLAKGEHEALHAPVRHAYPGRGGAGDTLAARLRHVREHGEYPLFRAHVGPWLPDRKAAVSLFLEWTRTLASSGFLDVLSIGTSQLSQERFFGDWEGFNDGGGVPLRSPEEFAAVARAAAPMLVRSYAGSSEVPRMARMLESSINIAWHALSLWWFSKLDGRGPNSLQNNLAEHESTLRWIATTGKPFEANVPHHFSFRGADDVTAIVAVVLAARLAKACGIRDFILQVMLNTPRSTWGIQDLAKARAMLTLVRSLEDASFRVILQPRGGLDYFSHDLDKARRQLAAVTALMDDIEPWEASSPDIIHVVSYSEARHLADPQVVDESIRITMHALDRYRALRRQGEIPDMAKDPVVVERTQHLLAEARALLAGIDASVGATPSARQLHDAFAGGFLPVPWLWNCRDEYPAATSWRTLSRSGAQVLVDSKGLEIPASRRLEILASANRKDPVT